MVVRRRAWLTREGWYYLAVLAFIIGGAVLRSVNLLVILAGTMIAPLLFNWRLVMASLMGLEVHRKLARQIIAGEPLTVEITAQNSRWWMSSWLLTVEDWVERQESKARTQESARRVHEAAAADEMHFRAARRRSSWRSWLWAQRLFRTAAVRAEALIPHVPARGSALGTYRITLPRRGRYRFGPLRVSTRFPLGLVRAQITLPQRDDLIVSPRLGRLLSPWSSLLEAEQLGDQRRHPQRGISEGDYYGLRPWQSGDSLRWIHWRTTAKLARPIVRQYERRRSRDVALVLDPWLPRRPAERDEGLVELAVSLTATAITDIASRGHSRLTVAIASRAPQCFCGPASDLFCEELLAHLAGLAATHEGDVSEALRRALETAPRGARLIVISPRPSSDPSLVQSSIDLPIEPDDLAWIDVGSEELESLFSFTA
jgi:uncharacterized protein (DUF58 family)